MPDVDKVFKAIGRNKGKSKRPAFRDNRPVFSPNARVAGPVPAPHVDPDIQAWLLKRPEWDGQPSPIPNCPDCNGTGRIMYADIHPGYIGFGKIYACYCRYTVIRANQLKMLEAASDLLPSHLALNWADVVVNSKNRFCIDAVKEIVARGWGWVYLHGPNGPGKTKIVLAAVAESIRASVPATFVTHANIINHLRAGVKTGEVDTRKAAWVACPLLAIDELQRVNETAFAIDQQQEILNARYRRATDAGEGVTLFTSNTKPQDLPDWLASRVLDSRFRVVELDAPDMRPYQGKGD